MRRVLIESALGIIFVFSGIFLIYNYLANAETRSNVLLLIASIFCTIIGVYCLYRGGKSDVTVNLKKEHSKENERAVNQNSGFGSVLQKNNDLLNQWNKTMAKRDKMKMLEISGAAEETR
ncbi:MAG TPA: DUF308 domain-containing protein [Candidatus Saccharimonadales bacterium]|nr:DUF308 domain-containing protein [Candidatus Saccharimonadales bacterium]